MTTKFFDGPPSRRLSSPGQFGRMSVPTACDMRGGKDLVVGSRKDSQMGEAADAMHRTIGAFNAHDAKETQAVFGPDREKWASGAGLHGAEGRVVRRSFCALDEASYLLDSVAEPWSVHLEVRLSGTVDEDRLRHALGMALARYPRARARAIISRRWPGRYEWEITPISQVDPLEVVVCFDDE